MPFAFNDDKSKYDLTAVLNDVDDAVETYLETAYVTSKAFTFTVNLSTARRVTTNSIAKGYSFVPIGVAISSNQIPEGYLIGLQISGTNLLIITDAYTSSGNYDLSVKVYYYKNVFQ